jgi:hypothetical protein
VFGGCKNDTHTNSKYKAEENNLKGIENHLTEF